MRNARDFVRPDCFLLQRMMRIALYDEMLEEAHILQAKERELMIRLPVISARLTQLSRSRT